MERKVEPAGQLSLAEHAVEAEDAVSSGRRANGRPTRSRARTIKSTIFAAAMAEFAERGFHGGSIVGIAERANVTRATVYKHFSSKEVILERLAHHTSTRLRASIEQEIDMDRPVWEVLQGVGRCFHQDGLSTDSKSISRILVVEANRFPDLVRKGYELRWYSLEPLAKYFEVLAMNGQVVLEDAPRAAQQFLHLVTSSVDYLFAEEGVSPKEQDRWVDSAVRIFLHGALRRA